MCVVVFSQLPNVTLNGGEAIDLAKDLLLERKWFANPTKTEPDCSSSE